MQRWEFDEVTVERFIVGPIEANCYLLTTGDSAILIDPGYPQEELTNRVEELKDLQSRIILLTHGHFDHTGYCPKLVNMGWRVGIHPEDEPLLNRVPEDFEGLGYADEPFEPYMEIREGWSYNIGSMSLQVLHTPGHSPGSVCFIGNKKRLAFTGDTMFADSVGRTDLPGGDQARLIESLKKLSSRLEPGTLILSGHGGRARFEVVQRINPYLREL